MSYLATAWRSWRNPNITTEPIVESRWLYNQSVTSCHRRTNGHLWMWWLYRNTLTVGQSSQIILPFPAWSIQRSVNSHHDITICTWSVGRM